jgi:hypothetical protein
MSLENKEQHCALCHALLFAEDDVVYCPTCGAPHHRECYNSKGDCALSEFHGTENQYDKLKRAEEEKKAEQEAKTQENQPDFETPFGQFTPIDFLGGVKPDTIIEEGVTAADAAKFVFSNTMRFIPKFARGRKPSFNLLAFLAPGGWFLSRKMYTQGIVAAIIEIVGTLLTLPFQLALNNLPIDKAANYFQYMQQVTEYAEKISPIIMLVAFVGSAMVTALKVLSCIFGDWIYRNHTIKTIRQINEQSLDKDTDFRKKGGVNLLLFILGVLAVTYLPAFIATLI